MVTRQKTPAAHGAKRRSRKASEIRGASRSYLSQVESVLTFGLGAADHLDSLEVFWPDGSRQSLDRVSVDSLLLLKQQP